MSEESFLLQLFLRTCVGVLMLSCTRACQAMSKPPQQFGVTLPVLTDQHHLLGLCAVVNLERVPLRLRCFDLLTVISRFIYYQK